MAEEMAKPVLLIGYGNTTRGDDGAGRLLAERIETLWAGTSHRAVSCHQLLPEHIDLVRTAGLVLFVDAAADDPAGSVRLVRLQPDPAGAAASHRLDPAALLALAEALGGQSPPAFLLTINGAQFEFVDRPSPPIAAAVDSLLPAFAPAAVEGWAPTGAPALDRIPSEING